MLPVQWHAGAEGLNVVPDIDNSECVVICSVPSY